MQSTPLAKKPTPNAQAALGLSLALSSLATFEREQIHTMLTALPCTIKSQVKQELSKEVELILVQQQEFTLEQLGLSFYSLLLAHYQHFCQS